MENAKVTLAGGVVVEASHMTVAEALALVPVVGVPEATKVVLAESVGMLAMTNKIQAIRLARAILGVGLKEAKLFVDQHHAAREALERSWRVAQSAADRESERLRRLDREQREREDQEAARNGDIPF